MFKVLGVDHIGIAVTDLKEVGAFWTEALGLPANGEETVAEQKVTTGFFPTPNGSEIELLAARMRNPQSRNSSRRTRDAAAFSTSLCASMTSRLLWQISRRRAYALSMRSRARVQAVPRSHLFIRKLPTASSSSSASATKFYHLVINPCIFHVNRAK